MELNNAQAVARMSEVIAVSAAKAYLSQHNLKADKDALVSCLSSWIKAKLPEAINDALDAYTVGMRDVGDATFKATMMQAGIEGAKEAGF